VVQPLLASHEAFPDHNDAPPTVDQGVLGHMVSCTIASNFLEPEGSPGLRGFSQMTPVSVPEASVHEYDGAILWQYEIGCARKIAAMKAEAKTPTV